MLETRDDCHFRVLPQAPVIGGWIEGGNLADLRGALGAFGGLFGRKQLWRFHRVAASSQNVRPQPYRHLPYAEAAV